MKRTDGIFTLVSTRLSLSKHKLGYDPGPNSHIAALRMQSSLRNVQHVFAFMAEMDHTGIWMDRISQIL